MTAAQEIPEPLSPLEKQLFFSASTGLLSSYTCWLSILLPDLPRQAAVFIALDCGVNKHLLNTEHFQCSYLQCIRRMQSFHLGSFNKVAPMLLWWRLPFSPPAGGSIADRTFWHKRLLFRDLCSFSLCVQSSWAQAPLYSHFMWEFYSCFFMTFAFRNICSFLNSSGKNELLLSVGLLGLMLHSDCCLAHCFITEHRWECKIFLE